VIAVIHLVFPSDPYDGASQDSGGRAQANRVQDTYSGYIRTEAPFRLDLAFLYSIHIGAVFITLDIL